MMQRTLGFDYSIFEWWNFFKLIMTLRNTVNHWQEFKSETFETPNFKHPFQKRWRVKLFWIMLLLFLFHVVVDCCSVDASDITPCLSKLFSISYVYAQTIHTYEAYGKNLHIFLRTLTPWLPIDHDHQSGFERATKLLLLHCRSRRRWNPSATKEKQIATKQQYYSD